MKICSQREDHTSDDDVTGDDCNHFGAYRDTNTGNWRRIQLLIKYNCIFFYFREVIIQKGFTTCVCTYMIMSDK